MLFPDELPKSLLSELHPFLNAIIIGKDINVGKTKLWWQCNEHGHAWETLLSVRKKGSGCPVCANRIVLSGFNDLATTNPKVASQWHPSRNGTMLPTQYTAKSSKRIVWLCALNHEWESSIANRQTTGCPYCAGTKVWAGFNDLATQNPELASEWDAVKNTTTPDSVSISSHQKIWWKCKLNHSYHATVANRTAGTACPICAGNKVLQAYNSLTITHSNLVTEWHPTKNKNLVPDDFSAGSDQKVWWIGNQCGHEWYSKINKRVYGSACPICLNRTIISGLNDFSTLHPRLMDEWDWSRNELSPRTLPPYSNQKVWWKCSKGHEWRCSINNRAGSGTNCPTCGLHGSSKAENELYNVLIEMGVTVKQHDRTLIAPYELDLVLPDHNIAIEYNGLYWHSEMTNTDRKYHFNKWSKAKNAGIQLIQIWEDDWLNNKKLILASLKHKLKITDSKKKVFARKTTIAKASTAVAQVFLTENHIQGFSSGTHYIGLYDNGTLCALAVFRKEAQETYNIIRYATSVPVVGGFTKLLKFVEKQYQPKAFITFADHCISNGKLYEDNGFFADKEIKPDYMYIVKGERKHKFGYRLDKFKNDPNLLWEPGLTEKELAILNGYSRIWDAGKTRYKKIVH